MNVASAFLRATDTQGAIYAPYNFSGDWSDSEKIEVQNAIIPYVPELVEASFNNWLFSKIDATYFIARKATWDIGCIGAETAEELAEKIADYYSR